MYAIKAEVTDSKVETFEFPHQKTMYGGKKVSVGDTIYVFASENEGGIGLVAKGIVTSASHTPKRPNVERQTPRVSVTIKKTLLAKGPLGHKELRPHDVWSDGRPETELNFKFYRQATNKIVGLSSEAVALLETRF